MRGFIFLIVKCALLNTCVSSFNIPSTDGQDASNLNEQHHRLWPRQIENSTTTTQSTESQTASTSTSSTSFISSSTILSTSSTTISSITSTTSSILSSTTVSSVTTSSNRITTTATTSSVNNNPPPPEPTLPNELPPALPPPQPSSTTPSQQPPVNTNPVQSTQPAVSTIQSSPSPTWTDPDPPRTSNSEAATSSSTPSDGNGATPTTGSANTLPSNSPSPIENPNLVNFMDPTNGNGSSNTAEASLHNLTEDESSLLLNTSSNGNRTLPQRTNPVVPMSDTSIFSTGGRAARSSGSLDSDSSRNGGSSSSGTNMAVVVGVTVGIAVVALAILGFLYHSHEAQENIIQAFSSGGRSGRSTYDSSADDEKFIMNLGMRSTDSSRSSRKKASSPTSSFNGPSRHRRPVGRLTTRVAMTTSSSGISPSGSSNSGQTRSLISSSVSPNRSFGTTSGGGGDKSATLSRGTTSPVSPLKSTLPSLGRAVNTNSADTPLSPPVDVSLMTPPVTSASESSSTENAPTPQGPLQIPSDASQTPAISTYNVMGPSHRQRLSVATDSLYSLPSQPSPPGSGNSTSQETTTKNGPGMFSTSDSSPSSSVISQQNQPQQQPLEIQAHPQINMLSERKPTELSYRTSIVSECAEIEMTLDRNTIGTPSTGGSLAAQQDLSYSYMNSTEYPSYSDRQHYSRPLQQQNAPAEYGQVVAPSGVESRLEDTPVRMSLDTSRPSLDGSNRPGPPMMSLPSLPPRSNLRRSTLFSGMSLFSIPEQN